jgi:phosphoglycolate phosphatase
LTAVIFDLDGTLVDSQHAIAASLRHVLRQCGRRNADDEDLRWALGPPLPDVMRRLLHSTDPVEIAQAVGLYRAHHLSVCVTHATIYPGIPDVLGGLTESGYRLFVATSKLRTIAEHILRHFSLSQHLDLSAGQTGRPFRDEERTYRPCCSGTRARSARDSHGGRPRDDILGARAHGIRSVAVAYGYGDRAELNAAGPDAICNQPEQLPAMLAGF